MLFDHLHSMLATATAIFFASLLLVPCLCATAMAQETGEPSEDCCPLSQEPTQDDRHDEDCCGGCTTACGEAEDIGVSAQGGVVISSVEVNGEIDGPNTWWTPDLVAALWFVDRLALLSEPVPTPEFAVLDNRPDRSDTYLQHATFLL